MGQLKDQLFLQHIDIGIGSVIAKCRKRHTPKKDNRFLIKGITYEIGTCRAEGGGYAFEISSKIPQEALPAKVKKETYFKEVLKILKKLAKKPSDSRMENIISAQEEELKERDYVNLSFNYKETELYTIDEVHKMLRSYQEKKKPLPVVPGVATPSGRMVMVVVEESMARAVTKHVDDLVAANDAVISKMAGKEAAVKKKPKAAAKPKKAAKKKSSRK